MKILAYHCPDAPERLRWLAEFMEGGGLLPIRFTGCSEEAVRSAAQSFWDHETERAAAKSVRRTKKTAPAAALADDVGDVI